MSASDAKSFFDREVKPTSWAWRNQRVPRSQYEAVPLTKSSRDYWRDKFAKREAMLARDAQRERQDDLGEVAWISVRCGYG
jgi:hypothetical protein